MIVSLNSLKILIVYFSNSGIFQVQTCMLSSAKGVLQSAFYTLRLYIFPSCTGTSFYTHLFYTTAVRRNSPRYQKTVISPTQTHTWSRFKSRIIIIGFFLLNSWNLNILPHPGYDFAPRVLAPFSEICALSLAQKQLLHARALQYCKLI